MGKASSNKKVARAAGTGGGRTARGRTPWLWYGGLSAVMVIGVLLVATSRADLNATVEHPDFKDHWHMAYGVYICGEFKPPMPQPPNLIGLHTHTDGLIHVEPTSVNDTGKNATVGRYASGQPGFKVSANELQYPGDKAMKNGDKCGDKPGRVEVRQWTSQTATESEKISGDPKDVKIENFHLITFAFVPEGTDVPKPPSAANLADPNANEGKMAPAPEGTPTTVAAEGTPTTVAPEGAPTTVAPAPTPTTASP